MNDFRERIAKLSPKGLTLLALELQSKIESLERERHEPIAIVGVGCRIPQSGVGADRFWNLLVAGEDAVSQTPPERWDASAWYDPDPDAPGRVSTTWGSFVHGADLFDSGFFNISAREAASMDPQQRLLLETCWEAIENAGRSPRSLHGSSTGVFLGLTNNDYHTMLFRRDEETLDTYVATGLSPSVAAGRISYTLGFQGPAVTIDTACSASLVSVHLACKSLRAGECSMALAGGVNLILSPEVTVALSKAHMMAPDGLAKAFDSRANGFVRGEGCGMIVLKRLSEAQRDGDRILALIRGSAVNQDGRSSGLTAPNGAAQEALLREALKDARLSGNDIDSIEAHGTGTSLGDPIEAHALAAVFGPEREPGRGLVVSSVKTNIGHLEAAAGIAGLIKTALTLDREYIPKHLHFESMNPHIDWGKLAVEIPVEGRRWPRGERVRRAGVSSFGFSGTNAHVILEEAPAAPRREESRQDWHILTLSARTPGALEELRDRYREALGEAKEELGDFCYTANAGRTHWEERAYFIGKDREQLLEQMKGEGGRGRKSGPVEVAFLFSGQGAQYAGMGRELYESEPVFRKAFDECAGILRGELSERLEEVVWGSRTELLNRTEYTQPALFAVEYALAQVWKSWGITPSMVAGHSVGEYVAACVAGVYSLEAGLKLIAARGRLMEGCGGRGVMSAVQASEERVREALKGKESRVSIAAVNAPESVVIAGYEAEVEEVESRLREAGVGYKRLAVSHGFHSPQMEEMEERFEAVAREQRYDRAEVKWVSSVTGELVGAEGVDAAYWRRQVRSAVRWQGAMEALEREGARVYLEIGPGSTLAGLGRECVGEREGEREWATSLRKNRSEWETMLGSLGKLYARGVEVDWEGYDRGKQRRRIALPTYPFQRRSYWAEGIESRRPKSSPSEPAPDWFYRVDWVAKPATVTAGPAANGDAVDFSSFAVTAERLRLETGFDAYDNLRPSIQRISAAYVVRAFHELGYRFEPGSEIDAGQLTRQLCIIPSQRRLFSRLLEILAEYQVLAADGHAWTVLRDPAREDAGSECRALATQFPAFRAEIEMLARCGDALAQVLTGRANPLQLLFGDGTSNTAEELYTEAPGLRVFNSLAASVIEEEARRRPGQKLRVLEIGAGTGGTTAWVAEVLPADRTEYCYTDISSAFLARAARKFARFPYFSYRTLDIERDPITQGFDEASFDIIIAANVLHATAEMAVTMRHARSLLAPSGLLVLIEGIRPERWVDLTFGLTEGWWRFNDFDLRPTHPLISPDSWKRLLTATGFQGSGAVRASDSQVAVIVARAAHTKVSQRVLIVPDLGGVAAELQSTLTGLGATVEIAAFEPALAKLNEQRFDGVYYLAALDAPAAAGLTSAALEEITAGCGSEILRLAQRLIERGGKLWLATRGVQPVTGSEPELSLSQAPVWGWAKTISLEHPAQFGGVIDLDPLASHREDAAVLALFLLGDGEEDQVAIRDRGRYVPRLVRTAPPDYAPVSFNPQKVYLIVGGLGGLGLNLARFMAQRGARRLVLASRSSLPDRADWKAVTPDSEVARQISAILEVERFGAHVDLRVLDVCDGAKVNRLIASVSAELGGIFHLAAAGQMSWLKAMTPAGSREVMAPKTAGAWNLHLASKDLVLDYFVLFSSWASVVGAQGLGHYNAANHFMDTLAYHRKQSGLPALTTNWGAWDVIRNASAALIEEYERSGLRSLAAAGAFTAMSRAAMSGIPQAVVADVDWKNLKALYEIRRSRPMLELASNLLQTVPVQASRGDTAQEISAEPAAAVPVDKPGNIRAEIVSSPSEVRSSRIVAYLIAVLSNVIGASAAQLSAATATDELGLDSLMALEARNRVNSELETNIPAVRFLQGLTIGQIAAAIETELPAAASPQPDGLLDAPVSAVSETFPLSFAQRAYWLVQKVLPETSHFNCAFSAKATPPLDFEAFQRAVWKLMERHAALRSIIIETEEGEPTQQTLKVWHPETTVIDAADLNEPELAAAVSREFHRPFDVTKSIFRIPVFRCGEFDILLFAYHHIVVDGTSAPLCFAELNQIYTAEVTARPAQLPVIHGSFQEFVKWEADIVHGPGFERLWEYWKNQLSGGLPELVLPQSRPRPASFLPRGERIVLKFTRELTRAVHDAARQAKTTNFSFLLAVFQILLYRYSGQDDLLVGVSSSSRDLAKWDNTVGCLVNLFPIRCGFSRDHTFAEHLARTKETVLSALDHQGIPFPLLVERLRIRRELGHPPLFQAFFNYLTERPGNQGRFLLGLPDATVEFGTSILSPFIELRHDEVQSDLMLYLVNLGEETYAYMTYNADLLDGSVAECLARDYISMVEAVTANPNLPTEELPISFQPDSEVQCEEFLL